MDKEKSVKHDDARQFIIKYGAVLIGALRLLYELAAGLLGEHHR